jgi:PTS system mannose-specific IIA component
MIGMLVVTHGGLAEELVAAARTIMGEDANLRAVSIAWDDDVSEAHRRMLEGVRAVDQGDGVILLTDMFGGTPTNVALSLLGETRVEIVTGANLPMIIKFANLQQVSDLAECARVVAEKGRSSIQVASAVLEGDARGTDGSRG